VEREQACCPFLSFEIADDHGAMRLTIVAPEEAREAADAVFAPFVQTGVMEAGCSCCGGTA
jgi:hypothetical protein